MEEPIVIGEGTGYPLQGILSMPDSGIVHNPSVTVPAVILVQGSGSSDRDETIFCNKPFRDLAEHLSSNGIAVIRYDKRSFTYGHRLMKDFGAELTVEPELVEDALLAKELLRNDCRIDPDRIYLLGHSLGGMLAPRIDAEGGDFAGLIIMAGSPYSLRDILMRQNDDIQNTAGPIMRFIVKMQMGKVKKVFDALPTMAEKEAKSAKALGSVYAWYFKDMENHPAESYLQNLDKPILFLQGEKDFQVSAAIDFTGYQRICEGKKNATFKLYPDLNHLFMPSVYGQVKDIKKEYKVPAKMSKTVLNDIAAWILADGKL